MGKDRLDVWNTLDTSPRIENGTVVSVYRVKDVKGAFTFD